MNVYKVPSFSWCFSCHSSLCEFHHQDHKLSIDTRGHAVSTLKEIAEEQFKIEPQLPPLSCPEALGADCSLLCKTCGYMVSTQAMVAQHKGHNIVDAIKAFPSCKEMVANQANAVQNSIGELMSAVESVKNVLLELEEDAE